MHAFRRPPAGFSLALLLTTSLSVCLTACSSDDSRLEARLTELEAREAIRELFTDYGRTLDQRDFTGFGELFAQDAEYLGGGGSLARGPAAIAAQLEDVITSNASGANLHVYANESISIAADGRHASALSRGAFYVQNGEGGPMPLMFASYRDEFVIEDGNWRFARREVIADIPGQPNEQRFGYSK